MYVKVWFEDPIEYNNSKYFKIGLLWISSYPNHTLEDFGAGLA